MHTEYPKRQRYKNVCRRVRMCRGNCLPQEKQEKNNDVMANSYLVAPLSMSGETGASGSRVARRSLTSPSPSES